jgi:hypothetical protein
MVVQWPLKDRLFFFLNAVKSRTIGVPVAFRAAQLNDFRLK